MSLPPPLATICFHFPLQVTNRPRHVPMKPKKSSVNSRFASIESVARESGHSWRFVKRRLSEAGITVSNHPRAEIIAALRPDAGDKDADIIKEKKTFEEWRKLKIANDAKEAALISKAEVADIASRLAEKFAKLLHKKLVIEYPATVAVLDVPGARIYGKKLNDQIRAEVRSWSKLWEGR